MRKIKKKSLEKIIYGPDGMSGLLGQLRVTNYFDQEKATEAMDAIKEFVKETKEKEDFPSNDVATLCDMCIDLSLNNERNKEASDFLAKLIPLIDQWYDDDN